jgi:excisionase family DNA binding protein
MSNSKSVPRKKHRRLGNGVLLTTEELATQLGESARSIRSWKHKGAIPYVNLGYRTHRFRLDDVLVALQRRTIKPASTPKK